MITPMTDEEFLSGIKAIPETHVQRLNRFIVGQFIDRQTKAQIMDFRRNIVMTCMLNRDIDRDAVAALRLCDLYIDQIDDIMNETGYKY